MRADPLRDLVSDILCGGDHFLSGIHNPSTSLSDLLTAIVSWGTASGRDLKEIVAVMEPCLRQSILMSLIPAKAFDSTYSGTIDAAIEEHASTMGLTLSSKELSTLRDVCMNARKLKDMSGKKARSKSASIAQLRGNAAAYARVLAKQGGRCAYCGVDLHSPHVLQTLDHVAPKHLGNDPPLERNWAVTCCSCNEGKADALAWAAQPQAHDYFTRTDFASVHQISLPHRVAVLLRSKTCDRCKIGPNGAELFVYRRLATGLPIPAHCSLTCGSCAKARPGLDLLTPRWAKEEVSRQVT